MLFAHTGTVPPETIATPHHAPLDAVWLDLVDPTDAERALAERSTGLEIPARADIEEIESSSRLYVEDGVLMLNTPMAFHDADGVPILTPLGFVLSERRLVTVRYAPLTVFEQFSAHLPHGMAEPSSSEVFLRLLEAIVDRLADMLEGIGRSMDTLSRIIFRAPADRAKPAATDVAMRRVLTGVGLAGDAVANVRSALLGVGRMVPYVAEMASGFIPPALRSRFKVLSTDIASLNDFDAQLSSKASFLLDATLGFINIEQNNGIKVLTIVSIVGIPPTFIASLYGMNFKDMPELQWTWGYEYALALMVVSGLAPLLWFRIKGWL